MADIICRWRNGTPKNVVELANALPHQKMKVGAFRSYMKSKWKDFFTAPYQLACQLGLYCEADDGFYYPRFDHDINEAEASSYLFHWLPRYYVPNPYVDKDGFQDIVCPTFVLKSLYEYTRMNPGTDYATAYNDIFKEEAKNNDDIVRNYINRYSNVMEMTKDGKLKIIDNNSQDIFAFMDRTDKKAFFDIFSSKEIDPMKMYQEGNLEQRKAMFRKYLESKSLSESTIKQYVQYHLVCDAVLDVIKKESGKDNLYEVVDLFQIEKIYKECNQLPENKSRNNVYTASVTNYKDFINFLETEEAECLYGSTVTPTIISEPDPTERIAEPKIPAEPFSIQKIIDFIKETGLLYSDSLIKRFAFSLMSKRFLILSGLAGSGKTQLALAFASALVRNKDEQMCVVSVGADWTNREPLLGFPNALQQGRYVKPESGVLDLLIEANRPENANKPFFLVLDEMNMSYVERYFADFLSAMESKEPISLWDTNETKNDTEETDGVPQKVALPKNFFIIGTINVDETTYMFSPKVLDRANVIEFKISSAEMGSFLQEMREIDRDSINGKAAGMGADFVEKAGKKELEKDDKAVVTLQSFFNELKGVNAEFGYRSATEIFRFICQAKANDDATAKMSEEEILDAAIVQKLLPKLHGSRKKLEPVLQRLWKLCFKGADKDLNIAQEHVEKAAFKESADKIRRMYESATANGFTSFAEA